MIVIVVVLVVVKLNSGSGSGSGSGSSGGVSGSALPAAVSKNVTTVPSSALDAVGTGTVPTGSHLVKAISGPPLTNAGKPEMLYIGAEFCPYCAAMRWPMAVSLSQFGTLSSPLHGIRSSQRRCRPEYGDADLLQDQFTSDHLTFTPVENETRTRTPRCRPPPRRRPRCGSSTSRAASAATRSSTSGTSTCITGPLFDPAVLKGLTWQQIATQLRDPSTPVAQSVLGAANFITAAICKTTGGQPGSVCSAPGVQKAASHL